MKHISFCGSNLQRSPLQMLLANPNNPKVMKEGHLAFEEFKYDESRFLSFGVFGNNCESHPDLIFLQLIPPKGQNGPLFSCVSMVQFYPHRAKAGEREITAYAEIVWESPSNARIKSIWICMSNLCNKRPKHACMWYGWKSDNRWRRCFRTLFFVHWKGLLNIARMKENLLANHRTVHWNSTQWKSGSQPLDEKEFQFSCNVWKDKALRQLWKVTKKELLTARMHWDLQTNLLRQWLLCRRPYWCKLSALIGLES